MASTLQQYVRVPFNSKWIVNKIGKKKQIRFVQ